MSWLLFLTLSAIAAVLFTPVNNWLNTKSTSLSTSNDTASKFFGSYAGRTAVIAVTFFTVLLVAATVLNFAGKKAAIPEVV